MNRHIFRGSRTNRDRREQTFARSVIAEATRRKIEEDNTRIMLQADEIEVCPDCFGKGEVVRHVSDTVVTEAVCLECNGNGWVK